MCDRPCKQAQTHSQDLFSVPASRAWETTPSWPSVPSGRPHVWPRPAGGRGLGAATNKIPLTAVNSRSPCPGVADSRRLIADVAWGEARCAGPGSQAWRSVRGSSSEWWWPAGASVGKLARATSVCVSSPDDVSGSGPASPVVLCGAAVTVPGAIP